MLVKKSRRGFIPFIVITMGLSGYNFYFAINSGDIPVLIITIILFGIFLNIIIKTINQKFLIIVSKEGIHSPKYDLIRWADISCLWLETESTGFIKKKHMCDIHLKTKDERVMVIDLLDADKTFLEISKAIEDLKGDHQLLNLELAKIRAEENWNKINNTGK